MVNITKNVLTEELRLYSKEKKNFLKSYRGQFVLIKGQKLVGSFTTEAEAYKVGVERFGNSPFLIKKVVQEEQKADIPALTIGVINVSL